MRKLNASDQPRNYALMETITFYNESSVSKFANDVAEKLTSGVSSNGSMCVSKEGCDELDKLNLTELSTLISTIGGKISNKRKEVTEKLNRLCEEKVEKQTNSVEIKKELDTLERIGTFSYLLRNEMF